MIGRIVRALRREGARFFVDRLVLALRHLAGYRAVLFFRIKGTYCSTVLKESIIEEYRPSGTHDNQIPWSPEAVSARLAEGHRMFILRVHDKPVSFAWVTESMEFLIGELNSWVTIDRPMVWIWDCVTPDAHRGRGYYPRLLMALTALFEADRMLIYSQARNYASIKGLRKAGFDPWMSVAATRWGTRIRRDGDLPESFRVLQQAPGGSSATRSPIQTPSSRAATPNRSAIDEA